MKQLQNLKKALNQKYLEREEVINGALVALISGEPMLVIGLPGSAKSMIFRDICASIAGQYFETMMTKTTVPEEIFGNFSLKALEQDKFYRNTEGKLPKADIAFIDEVFKGSSTILNTLLNITNEKTFNNGGTVEQTPLRVLYAASNEISQAEELGAFYDRMVLRYNVKYVQQESSVRMLFKGLNEVELPKLSLKEVDQMKNEAKKLEISDEIVNILIQLRREVDKEGMIVSDRKWVQATRLIKAQALLNGNKQVEADDLEILVNVLWSHPDQAIKVRKMVAKHVNPLGEKIQEIIDAANMVYSDLMNKGSGDSVEVFQKLKAFRDKLNKMKGLNPNNTKIDSALENITSMYTNVAREKLQLEVK